MSTVRAREEAQGARESPTQAHLTLEACLIVPQLPLYLQERRVDGTALGGEVTGQSSLSGGSRHPLPLPPPPHPLSIPT